MASREDRSVFPMFLRDGYQRYLAGKSPSAEPLAAAGGGGGESPQALWIGCVDSRVMPDSIFGTIPGELLILRNMANMVPPLEADEASVGAVIHYAVGLLQVRHIVVCGHSDCRGVQALMNLGGKGPMDKMLASWAEYGMSALEDDAEQSLESVSKTNVLKQAARLESYPDVKAALDRGALNVHPLYFDIGTGLLQAFDSHRSEWVEFS